MINSQAEPIRRLNVLLKLASRGTDLALLNNGAWSKLLDELYWAILAEKQRTLRDDVFHHAATRLGVKTAQEGLRGQLSLLQQAQLQKGPLLLENVPSFELTKQTLYLLVDEKGFFPRYVSTDFPTMTYSMLYFLIDRLELKPSDLLTCANEKCRTVFVPVRKRSDDDRAFCSPKCANLIAALEYRRRKGEQLKARERERSSKRYDERVHNKPGFKNVTIRKRPRKPKQVKPVKK